MTDAAATPPPRFPVGLCGEPSAPAVSAAPTHGSRTRNVVLVALDTEYATVVAGASLRTALTVVFH